MLKNFFCHRIIKNKVAARTGFLVLLAMAAILVLPAKNMRAQDAGATGDVAAPAPAAEAPAPEPAPVSAPEPTPTETPEPAPEPESEATPSTESAAENNAPAEDATETNDTANNETDPPATPETETAETPGENGAVFDCSQENPLSASKGICRAPFLNNGAPESDPASGQSQNETSSTTDDAPMIDEAAALTEEKPAKNEPLRLFPANAATSPEGLDSAWTGKENALKLDLGENSGIKKFSDQNSAILDLAWSGPQTLVFDGFATDPADGRRSIEQLQMYLSLASLPQNSDGGKIELEYRAGEDEWAAAGSLALDDKTNNSANKGFFVFQLTAPPAAAQLDRFAVRLKYEPNDVASGQVYLDAAWLEAEFGEVVIVDEPQDEPKSPRRNLNREKPVLKLPVTEANGFWENIWRFFTFKKEKKLSFKIKNVRNETGIAFERQGSNLVITEAEKRSFRPGKYTLTETIDDNGAISTTTQDFSLGVLAINTDKAAYKSGEEVSLQMGAVNGDGHTICGANLKLEITTPSGAVSEPIIATSTDCGIDNYTLLPDYSARYQTQETGFYAMKLTNLDNGDSINDSFEVSDSLPFEIRRTGPSRINPSYQYQMVLDIKTNKKYHGKIIETLPAGFVAEGEGMETSISGDSVQLSWDVDLKAGETHQIIYTFDAPDVFPFRYFLGPLQIGKFVESREWQIASDWTITSLTSGNWNDTDTWTGGVVPGSSDIAVITSTHTVTVTDTRTVSALTFSNTSTGGTVSVDSGQTLTVTNAITVTPKNSANRQGTITGSGSMTAASVAVGTSITAGSSLYTVKLYSTISSLSVANNITLLGVSLGVPGYFGGTSPYLYINSGTVTAAGISITVPVEAYVYMNSSPQTGYLNLTSNTPWTISGAGSTTINLNGSDSTVEYSGGAETVYATTYRHLKLSGSGTKTMTNVSTINGNLTMSGTAAATTAVNTTIGGYLTVGDGTSFTAAGYNLSVAATTTVGGGTSGTLTISSATGTKTFTGAVIVNAGGTWNNSGNEDIAMKGGLTNGGTFTAGSGVYTMDTNNQSITCNATTTIPSLTATTITVTHNCSETYPLIVSTALSGTGTIKAGTSSYLKIGGTSAISNWDNTTNTPNTVDFYGSGAQTIPGITYHHLKYTGSNTGTLGGNIVVNGDMTINSGGTVNTSAANNYTVTWNGSFSKAGTFTANASPITIGGTSASPSIAAFTTTGACNFTRTSSTATLGGNMTCASLTMNGSGGTLNLGSSLTHTFSGNVTMTAGTLNGGSSTLKTAGVLSGTGATFTAASGTVEFNGSSEQTIPAYNFYNLTSSSSGARVLASSGTVGVAGTLTPGGNSYTITGSTIDFNGSGSQTIPAFNYNNLTSSSSGSRTLASSGTVGVAGTFTKGTNSYTITGSTIDFNGSGSQTIPAFNYNNLTSSSSGGRTLASSGTVGVAGTFTPGGNSYTITGSTIDFNGTTQNVATFTYNNLTLSNSGTKTCAAALTINSDLSLSGTAKMALASGSNSTANQLYFSAARQYYGTWGSTSSAASFKNDTWFSASTGIVTVAAGETPCTAGTWDGSASTDWNTAANWCYDTIPTATTTVTIPDVANQPVIGAAGGLCADITIDSGATLEISSTYALSVAGNWVNNSSTSGGLIANSSTVTFTGASKTISGSGSTTFYNVTTSGSATIATGIATTIGGALSIGDGTTFTAAGYDLTVTGATTVGAGASGHLEFTSTTGTKIFTGLVTVAANGHWNNIANENVTFRGGLTNGGTFTSGSGVYTFDTNSQDINCSVDTTISNMTVTDVTVTNKCTGYFFTVNTALAGSGGLTQWASARLRLNGSSTISTLTATATGNAVYFISSSPQTIYNTNYYDLVLTESGKTLQTGTTNIARNFQIYSNGSATTVGPLAIGGALDISSVSASGGSLTLAGYDFSVGGTTKIGSASFTGSLIINNASGSKIFTGLVTNYAGGTWNNSGNSDVVFKGGLTNSGTFTAGSGTYTFNTNAQNITCSSASVTIPNLTATGITVTNKCAGIYPLTISTALAGTGALAQDASANLFLEGSAGIATLTATAADNTVNFSGAGSQTIPAINFYNIVNSSSGTRTLASSGTIGVAGTFTPGANSYTITGSTVNYNGTDQNVATTTYNNLTLSNSGTKTCSAALTINSDLSLSGTAKMALASGTNSTANQLYFSAARQYYGTWGSTSSSATNKTDTWFSASTGIVTVAAGVNAAPAFSVAPHEDPVSATSTPTVAGDNVTFTASSTDTNGDDWYLAICKTDAIATSSDAAPTCPGGEWGISAATNSGIAATVIHTSTTTDAGANAWFGFACDKTANDPKCSPMSNSGTTGDNGSTFYVLANQTPIFGSIEDSPDPVLPSQNITFTATSTYDPDEEDTISLYICKTNSFSSGCESGQTWCSATGTVSNPSCDYAVTYTDTIGTKNYWAFVVDNNGLESASNPRAGTFEISPSLSFALTNNLLGFGNFASTNERWATSDGNGDTGEPTSENLSNITVSTNAPGGLLVSAKSSGSGASAGLYKSILPARLIPAAGANEVSNGAEGYAVYVKNAGGNLTVTSGFDGATSTAAISTSFQTLITSSGPLNENNTANIVINAAISGDTTAGNYGDTLTIVATGKF